MLNRFVRLSVIAVFLAVTMLGFAGTQQAHAGGSAVVVKSVVDEADIGPVVDLIETALVNYQGLSLEDHATVYNSIGRTNRAIDLLYDTGATGDAFNTAEDLLLTQLDFLHQVEAATLSEDLSDMNNATVMLVDLAQRRLAFQRQIGEPFTLLAAEHPASVVDIARDDTATRRAMAEVMSALATGRPVGLEISDLVYRALGETSRGLDLVNETFETGDVFKAAVNLLDRRFTFLINLEEAVISGDLDDLRIVANDWIELSKDQLVFERQLAARKVDRASRRFLDGRQNSFFSRRSLRNPRVTTHNTQVDTAHDTQVNQQRVQTRVVTVAPGDTLSAFAEQFGTTVEAIARLNNINQPSQISPGMRIVVPEADGSQ